MVHSGQVVGIDRQFVVRRRCLAVASPQLFCTRDASSIDHARACVGHLFPHVAGIITIAVLGPEATASVDEGAGEAAAE